MHSTTGSTIWHGIHSVELLVVPFIQVWGDNSMHHMRVTLLCCKIYSYIFVIGLMVTSAALFKVLHFLNITIDIRNICVFLAPFFSSLTTLITYLLTKELKVQYCDSRRCSSSIRLCSNYTELLQDQSAGLCAAAFISIVPGYISRSVAGSYDNEGIAIFCMLFTYYLWIKAVKTGSIFWAALCSLAYFYMVRCVTLCTTS